MKCHWISHKISLLDATSCWKDLKRRYKNQKYLVTRRKILSNAKNEIKNYQEAPAFSQYFWNSNTIERNYSENTLDDVLLYF